MFMLVFNMFFFGGGWWWWWWGVVNKLAHTLARKTILSVDTDVWMEELPNDLDDIFQLNFIN